MIIPDQVATGSTCGNSTGGEGFQGNDDTAGALAKLALGLLADFDFKSTISILHATCCLDGPGNTVILEAIASTEIERA